MECSVGNFWILKEQGRFSECLKDCQSSLEMARGVNDLDSMGRFGDLKGEAYITAGNLVDGLGEDPGSAKCLALAFQGKWKDCVEQAENINNHLSSMHFTESSRRNLFLGVWMAHNEHLCSGHAKTKIGASELERIIRIKKAVNKGIQKLDPVHPGCFRGLSKFAVALTKLLAFEGSIAEIQKLLLDCQQTNILVLIPLARFHSILAKVVFLMRDKFLGKKKKASVVAPQIGSDGRSSQAKDEAVVVNLNGSDLKDIEETLKMFKDCEWGLYSQLKQFEIAFGVARSVIVKWDTESFVDAVRRKSLVSPSLNQRTSSRHPL